MYRLHLLGGVQLCDEQGVELRGVVAQPKRLALVAYLSLHPRLFPSRDSLLALFWPELDQEHARKALNKAVHFLRQAIGEEAIVSRGATELSLNRELVWCDVTAFSEAIELGRYDDALELYQGELLPAFYIDDAPGFEQWLEEERRRLRSLAATAAAAEASRHQKSGNFTLAVNAARRAVELTDSDERAVRQLLALLDAAGDRTGALREYESFERRMFEEFAVEPAPETKALVNRIRSRSDPAANDDGAALPLGAAPLRPADVTLSTRTPGRLTTMLSLAGALSFVLLGFGALRAWPSLASRWARSGEARRADNPNWVLVADFESPHDDSAVGVAVRELVSTVLDESRVLTTIPRDQLNDARRAAQMPDSVRLTSELARHLAYRTGVRFVIEGRVDRVGRGSYGVILRALGVEDGRVLAAQNDTATDQSVIPTVERLTRSLLASLGTTSAYLPPAPPLGQVVTASFDAYRHYAAGLQQGDDYGNWDAAVRQLREDN